MSAPITTRRELANLLKRFTDTTRELRFMRANQPRGVRLKPHILRAAMAMRDGTGIPPDDPIWKVTLNADGTGPTFGEFTPETFEMIRDEHHEWAVRLGGLSDENIAIADALTGAMTHHSAADLGGLWDALPEDGTPTFALNAIP